MFFNIDLVIYNPEINNWTEYSIELMQNNDMIKKVFVDVLRALGTGAKDVKVKLEKIKLADLPQELQLPDALKGLLGTQEGNRIEAKIVYDGKEERAKEGDTHYCPKGHSHTLINDSNENIEIFAVVPMQ